MKKIVLIATVVFIPGLTYMEAAFAHAITSSLNVPAGSVDLYQITCTRNAAGTTGKFIVRVKAGRTAPLVNVQAYKGRYAANATDLKGGDAFYSADAVIKGGGDGIYTILVDKNGAGANTYSLDTHCQTTTGAHAGQSDRVLLQNQ